MNEQEKFLQDLEHDQEKGIDVLDQPLTPEPANGEGGEEGAGDTTTTGDDTVEYPTIEGIKPKNRKEFRRLSRLAAEKDSSIYLAGKLEARTEAQRAVTEESDYLKGVERIYGNETPEAQIATELLKKAIVGARDDAKAQALEGYRLERQKEIEEERAAQDELDGFIEDIEDTYNVTLTEPQERSFFQLLQRMSPKDTYGQVASYADPHAVWEVFQERVKRTTTGTNSRAKELSTRSMTQSGASKESALQDDTHARFLKENGII